MNPHYLNVARRAGRRCEYRRAPEVVFNFPFEVEHIVPEAAGGTDDESNLALACRSCNVRKSDHRTGWDDVIQCEVPLFNPREDRWPEHFQPDLDTGEILGLTSVGRATVARLDINHPVQLTARLFWIRLRLFP